jgi:hypothetical protein
LVNDSAKQYNSAFAYSLIQVYPNPAQNSLTVTYPCISSDDLIITIKDVSGQLLYSASNYCNEGSNAQFNIEISSFTAGVYFIDLTLNEQHVVKKIVKM